LVERVATLMHLAPTHLIAWTTVELTPPMIRTVWCIWMHEEDCLREQAFISFSSLLGSWCRYPNLLHPHP
jgi:hypothetical protein